ncbi:MAG: hypothetical protein R3A48_11965 [Polyangiales bacterium]
MNTLLHERHLLEAVRRGVISQAQAEALLGLARTEEGGDARLPDTSWLGLVQAAVALFVTVGVSIANVDHPYRTSPAEEGARSLLAAAIFFAAGYALRRVRSAEAPASVLLAGAALQALGLVHAVARFSEPYASSNRMMWFGFAALVVVGGVMWRAMRVGPALGVLGLGLVGISLELSRHAMQLHGYRRDFIAFAVAGAALTAITVALDHAPRRAPVDGGFWTSLGAGLAMSLAGAILIDREPLAAFPALGVALLVGRWALQHRRRLLLAGVGVALFALPPFAASEARLGDAAVALALLVSAVGVGVGAHFTRGALFARAASGDAGEERSVWC